MNSIPKPLQSPNTSFELLDLLIGPMGGFVTIFIVLYAVYVLLKRYIIPMIQGAINRHLEQFEEAKKYTCKQLMECLKKKRRKHNSHKKLQTIIIQVRP